MRDFLSQEFLGVEVQRWLFAIAVALVVTAVLPLFRKSKLGRDTEERRAEIQKRRKEAREQVRNILLNMLQHTRKSVVFVVASYGSWLLFSLPERITSVGRQVAIVAILLQLGWWGEGLITYWFEATEKKHLAEGLKTLARVAMWVLIVLIGLENFGFNTAAAITGLGITGVAVALSTQQILGDLFAFFSITSDEPFVRGDFLVLDKYCGNVEYIGLRSTRIRSLSGELLVFSNSDLLQSRIQNFKTLKSRRVVIELSVVYQTPHEKLAAIPDLVEEIVKPIEQVGLDRVHFNRYGDSSLDFEIVYFILTPDYNKYMDIRQEINLGIFKRFEAEGIRFAYPTRTLHLGSEIAKAGSLG